MHLALVHSLAAMPARYGDISIPEYRFPTAACIVVNHTEAVRTEYLWPLLGAVLVHNGTCVTDMVLPSGHAEPWVAVDKIIKQVWIE